MTEALMNISLRFAFLLDVPDGLIGAPAPGTDVSAPANGAADVVNNVVQNVPPETTGSMWSMLLPMVAIFGLMYLLLIRPQRKREKKMKEMQAAITTGDNVVTTGGFFGRVTDVGEDCFIVEFGTNRGLRVPVLKSDVVGVRSPKMTPPPREAE